MAKTTDQPASTHEAHLDEVDHVLTALRRLKNQITNPVVKECLEAARSDIAHLAGTLGKDEEEEEDEDDEDDDFPGDDDDEDDEDDDDEDEA
jgi:hypothetical protein